MENQNPNVSEDQLATESTVEVQPQESEQYLFYNVMPKTKTSSLVEPTLTVVQQPQIQTEEQKKRPARKRLYIIIAISTVLLAGLGYWIWYTFGLNAYKSDIVVTGSGKNKAATTTSTSTPSSKDAKVTTPSDWQAKYFGSTTCSDFALCGDNADPDRDGLTNIEEYKNGTDPNNPDSDQDGISDGDEVHVFLTNPLQSHTIKGDAYSDADYVKGGYDITTQKPYAAQGLSSVMQRMQTFGLHEPTIKTVGEDFLINFYHFNPATLPQTPIPAASSTPQATTTQPSAIDQSPQAKQQRDAQRSNTINTISLALLKYEAIESTYPQTPNFLEMVADIKPYNQVATNPIDPINKDPYLYSYQPTADGKDFTLSFYSETQGQLIKMNSADAQKAKIAQQSLDNDEQRKTDLEAIQSALLLYSSKNAAGNQNYVFPTKLKYKASIVPAYLSSLPKDPVSGQDYPYEVSATFDAFTVKAVLQIPPTGNTGYVCNQDSCQYY